MTLTVPEPCQRRCQFQSRFDLIAFKRPCPCDPQVIMVQLQSILPVLLPGAKQVRLCLLRDAEVVIKMTILNQVRFSGLIKFLSGILTDWLKKPVTRLILLFDEQQ